MPLDAAAFAKTKAALGVQLAGTLAAACGAHVTASEQALEVLWQGFAFRLVLVLDRWGGATQPCWLRACVRMCILLPEFGAGAGVAAWR